MSRGKSELSRTLPVKAKAAIAQELRERGHKVEDIAKMMGVATSSVSRYIYEMPTSDWEEYRNQVKKLITLKETDTLARTLAKIDEKMDEANFRELVGWYKVGNEVQQARTPTPSQATQVNVMNVLSTIRANARDELIGE